MLLGVIPMFCFRFLSIFGKKRKRAKIENWAFRAPTLQRREPTPWRSPVAWDSMLW